MSKANTVTIEHIEIKKSDIAKVKKFFKSKDNAEDYIQGASATLELKTSAGVL